MTLLVVKDDAWKYYKVNYSLFQMFYTWGHGKRYFTLINTFE